MTPNPELESWRTAAPRWARDAVRIQNSTSEATSALFEALAPRPGQTILDVACGPGDPSLRLAELVGPQGRVVSTDGVAEMVDETRRRAQEAGLSWLETHAMPAEALALPDDSVDAACCRFGTMFFSDPDAALAQLARIVRPGGRIVLVVWGAGDENPFLACVPVALDAVGAPPLPPEHGTRSVFEYGEPGLLAGIAERAGWRDVTDEHRAITVTESDVTPETLFEQRCADLDRLAWRADQLDDDARARARELVTERAAPYARDGGIAFPATIRVVTGKAP